MKKFIEIDALMSNQKLIIDLKNKFGSMLKKSVMI